MRPIPPTRRCVHLLLVLAFTLGATSCGTILYPERRGQAAGRIDPAVALMNAAGLILFIVPGVIAFAVDFTTGAIYLPAGSTRLDLDPARLDEAQVVRMPPRSLDRREIEAHVAAHTGRRVDLAAPETRAARPAPGGAPEWKGLDEVLTPDQLAAFGRR